MHEIKAPQYLENDQLDIVATQKKFEEAVSVLSPRDFFNYKHMVLYVLENECKVRDRAAVENLAQLVNLSSE